MYFYGTGSIELYNLSNDIGEHFNLAAEYPKKTEELMTLLNQRLKAENAQFPVNEKTGEVLYPKLSFQSHTMVSADKPAFN